MQSWLKDCHAVVLCGGSLSASIYLRCSVQVKKMSDGQTRTLSMCSRVVLPALSRPRKRSLACLFIKPREARTSQTAQVISLTWFLRRDSWKVMYTN